MVLSLGIKQITRLRFETVKKEGDWYCLRMHTSVQSIQCKYACIFFIIEGHRPTSFCHSITIVATSIVPFPASTQQNQPGRYKPKQPLRFCCTAQGESCEELVYQHPLNFAIYTQAYSDLLLYTFIFFDNSLQQWIQSLSTCSYRDDDLIIFFYKHTSATKKCSPVHGYALHAVASCPLSTSTSLYSVVVTIATQ